MPGGGSLTSSAAAATASNWALIWWFCTRTSTVNTTAPTTSSTAANANEACMAATRPARCTTVRSLRRGRLRLTTIGGRAPDLHSRPNR